MKYFAPFRMDRQARTLWRGHVRIPLTHKAFDILRVLVDSAGHVVGRDALLGAVWPDTNVHPDNVKVLIGEIRRALGDDPARPQFIRSIVKRGYVFIAPVVEAPRDLSPPAAELPIFVGREAPMQQLVDAFDAAVDATRQIVFVTGDSGVGKTALCEAFMRVGARRHAMRATWARCLKAAGPSEPYCALADVVSRLTNAASGDEVGAILLQHAPSWMARRATIAGDLRRLPLDAGGGPAPSSMLREIVTALETLAEDTTLVVWLDDMHWADPATVDVIGHLGERPDAAKLLVIVASRPLDSVPSASALRRVQADLLAQGRASQIRLTAFTRDEVASYLDARFGHDLAAEAANVLYRTTNGNPLFLATAADHLVEQQFISQIDARWVLTLSSAALEAAVPASLASAVTQNLAELTVDERRAISAASVIGNQVSLWLAAHAAGTDEITLEPVLELLARRQRFIAREGVIELANGQFSPLYRFRHHLYQEIVLDQTPETERAAAHARAGLAIETLFAGRLHEAVGDLACHFHGANDHARASHYLRLAAANALRRYAPREAAALLHGAVAHAAFLPDDERRHTQLPMMLELGKAQLAAGEAALAMETLARMARRAADSERKEDQLRALLAVADVQAEHSREATLHTARQIGDLAAGITDPVLGATAMIRSSLLQIQFDGWSDELADRCVDRWRLIQSAADEESRSLAIRLLFLQTTRAAYQAAWTAGRRLLTASIRTGSNLSDTLHCCHSLAVAALHLGRWGDAMEIALEGAAIADKAGSTRHAVVMRLLQAWVALEGQRWDEARRLSLAGRSQVLAHEGANALQMSLLFGGAAAIGQGDFSRAAADLERLRDWHRHERLVMDWFWKGQLHGYLAELALRVGDLTTAAREAQRAQDASSATPERTWRGRAHVIAAQVAIAREAFADADRFLRLARRETRGIDAPLASWRIEAVTATLLERTAQPDSARRARIKYERTFTRLEQSMDERHFGAPGPRPPDSGQIH